MEKKFLVFALIVVMLSHAGAQTLAKHLIEIDIDTHANTSEFIA